MRKLLPFKDSGCTFSARVKRKRKKRSLHQELCVPEQLALKGLNSKIIFRNSFVGRFDPAALEVLD